MKILLSAYACDPRRGSENKSSWSWFEYYLRAGHEVYLLTMDWGKENIDSALENPEFAKGSVHYVQLPDWVERNRKNRKGGMWLYLHYILFQQYSFWAARKLDKSVNFDVVQHVSWGSLQMGSGLWKLGKPLIFGPVGGGQFPPTGFESYFQDGWEKEVRRIKVSNYLLRFYFDSKATLRKARKVLVVNQETYDLAKANGAKEVEYFLDASFDLDIPQANLRQSAGKPLRLMWVGRLLHRKGIAFTLEIIKQIPASVPVHLDIYGDGPQGKMIPQWIDQHQLGERVTWHGQVSWETVLKAYQNSDVFIFNSLRESFGVQLIEAMTAGLPIVCLDLHGAATFVPGEAALKVPVTNPTETAQAMAQAITQLYEQPNLRFEMGEAGYSYAKEQSLMAKTGRIHQLLSEVTGKEVLPAAQVDLRASET